MKRVKTFFLILLIVSSGMLPGCGGSNVDSSLPPEYSQTTATLGQQLIDLYAAYQSGAIEKDQYEELKESLLEKYID